MKIVNLSAYGFFPSPAVIIYYRNIAACNVTTRAVRKYQDLGQKYLQICSRIARCFPRAESRWQSGALCNRNAITVQTTRYTVSARRPIVIQDFVQKTKKRRIEFSSNFTGILGASDSQIQFFPSDV